MSGTDHARSPDWEGPGPVFVLVRPQMGENIGAAARGMWNFGLDRLRLVDPRDGWPNPLAEAMASGAARVLDHVAVAPTTAEALHDLNYVFATTARNRDLNKIVLTPEAAMGEAHARIKAGERVGVLFGPERTGLENDEIVRANALISVPVNPGFASLNLAQSVLLMAYEWRRQSALAPPPITQMGKPVPASAIEVEKLGDHLVDELDAAHFFWPPTKKPSMILALRNMLSGMPLTALDVRMIHGALRALTRRKRPD